MFVIWFLCLIIPRPICIKICRATEMFLPWLEMINSKGVDLYQGCNARKIISGVYAFFVLQCTVFGRKSKHKTDVTAWHGIHFHKNNLWNILVIENYFVNYQKLSKYNASRILDEHWCIYSCLQIPPRENWFQYVRWVYTTAINFPYITALVLPVYFTVSYQSSLQCPISLVQLCPTDLFFFYLLCKINHTITNLPNI